MRKVDAPPAGWYPDPEHRLRLRWWDGLDWTDIRRAPPSDAELIAAEEQREFDERFQAAAEMARQQQYQQVPAGMSRQDVQDVIAEVRKVARSELNRAAEDFSHRADTAVRKITPLITDYTNTAVKWIRRAVIAGIVLLVAYFVFQVIVQASFFDWLGDRIDNWTNDESAPITIARRGPPG